MKICFPYRYLLIGLASIGFAIAMSFTSAFVLVVAHTIRKNISDGGDTSFYPDCTSYNSSTDYISDYDQLIAIQFHAVYCLAMFVGTLFSGYITSRFPCHDVLGVAVFLSSFLFLLLPTVFQTSSDGVFIIRFLQGFLFMMKQPCTVLLVNPWAKEREKSTFLSLSLIGTFLSPALTNFTVGACLCYISWDSAFYIYGASGILWSLLWAKLSYAIPEDCPYIGIDELNQLNSCGKKMKDDFKSVASHVPWKDILACKAVWAIWLANFCKFAIASTMVTVSPLFFLDVFGIRAADSGLLLSVPFLLNAFSSSFFSFVADRLITSKTLRTTVVRKIMQCVGCLAEAICFICMSYANAWQMSYLFLLLAYSFDGMTVPGYICNTMDLSVQYTGAVAAFTMTAVIGAFTGTLVSSFVTGQGHTTDDWEVIFWMEAAIATITAVIYFLFATSERQPWDGKSDVRYETIPSSDDNKRKDLDEMAKCMSESSN